MFLAFRRKIELRRHSKKWFWRWLVVLKDIIWWVKTKLLALIYFPRLYFFSWLKFLNNQHKFNEVKTYCMFIGYSRSGHSIIGSILDAHPNIIIGHELDVLRFVSHGFGRGQIFSLLLDNSEKFTTNSRIWENYFYLVPGQWHSKFKKLLVVGDKCGDLTSQRLRHNFKLFDKLRRKLDGVDIKIIHVYRNPYDNITTIFKKRQKSLDDAIDYYFNLVDSVLRVKQILPTKQILDVKQEDFIANPKKTIKRLCDFLGVDTTPDYLTDAASIVWQKPHRSRFEADWTPALIDLVAKKKSLAHYLRDYSYDE